MFVLLAGYGILRPKIDSSVKSNVTQGNKEMVAVNEPNNKPLETLTLDPDMYVSYTDINQLVKNADFIVEGKVTDVSYFDFNTATNTTLSIEVTKSYNSNIKNGQILTFVEPGGITTKAALINYSGNKFNEPIGETEKNTKVQVLIAGAPLTKINENVLLFAKEGTLNALPQKYYVSIGAFQGKFIINGDSIGRYVPKGMELGKYSSLNMSKADFDQKLSEAVKNKK